MRRRTRHADTCRGDQRAFTLIELIVVMLLLAIAASLVAPRMSSFIRGRTLNVEARRMLTLTQYAQSRAVADGVPVLVWFDPRNSTYGAQIQSGYEGGRDPLPTYTADPGVTFVAAGDNTTLVSESEDEKFGLPEGLPVIRFNPDGFFDEISIQKIVLQQQNESGLELVQKENRLGYEIRPATNAN